MLCEKAVGWAPPTMKPAVGGAHPTTLLAGARRAKRLYKPRLMRSIVAANDLFGVLWMSLARGAIRIFHKLNCEKNETCRKKRRSTT